MEDDHGTVEIKGCLSSRCLRLCFSNWK